MSRRTDSDRGIPQPMTHLRWLLVLNRVFGWTCFAGTVAAGTTLAYQKVVVAGEDGMGFSNAVAGTLAALAGLSLAMASVLDLQYERMQRFWLKVAGGTLF